MLSVLLFMVLTFLNCQKNKPFDTFIANKEMNKMPGIENNVWIPSAERAISNPELPCAESVADMDEVTKKPFMKTAQGIKIIPSEVNPRKNITNGYFM